MKSFIPYILMFLAMSLVVYANSSSDISNRSSSDISNRFVNVFCSLYDMLRSLVPVAIIVAIVFAAIVMIVGQVFGSETKARANSWAQSIVLYTLVAVVILFLVPYIIGILSPELNLSNACG